MDSVIHSCYQKVLKRNADSEGIKSYSTFLNSGKSEEDLCKILRQSDEYKNINFETHIPKHYSSTGSEQIYYKE